MLLKDKYIPKTFDESFLNLNIIKKIKNINKTTMDNIIFYGINGTGKYILARMLLENLYGKEIYKIKKQIINFRTKTFYLYSSNYHFEIIINNNNFDKDCLNNIIKNISQSLNIVNNHKNIILIKNSEYLENETMFLIKKLCEKGNISFILLTNKLFKLSNTIKHISINIRVPILDENELVSFIKHIKKTEKIKMYIKDIKEIIRSNNKNINKILLDIEYFNNYKTINKDNIINDKLDKILILIYEKKTDNILKIRKILYDICSKNTCRYVIVKYCFEKMLKRIKDNNNKIKLVSFVNEINEKLSKSFKNMIHIEYFLIKLMDFIE